MFKDLRSPEHIAAMERDTARRQKHYDKLERIRKKANKASQGVWSAIETMPFEAMSFYSTEPVLVSDGEEVGICRVRTRFGTPIRWKKAPEMAMTDHGMAFIGGEIEELDWPEWRLKYEFIDETAHESEMYGKAEISFVPTHWMPLPDPPKEQG